MAPAEHADSDPAPFTSGRQLELLSSIYQHRLITTTQLHRLHLPDRSRSAIHNHLTALHQAGLAAAHQPRPWLPAVWYTTTAGARIAELDHVTARTYRASAEIAAGPILQHTLAVNEVGCLLVEAARERGDEFGPLDWEHEISHPLRHPRPGEPTSGHRVVADAVLYYTANVADDAQLSVVRFLELDRGTLSAESLVQRIRRYGQMHDYQVAGRPAWRARYTVFPRLIIVLDGLPPHRLARRQRTLIDLCREEPDILAHAPTVGTVVTTMPDLTAGGPFAEVFHPLVSHPEHGDAPLTLLRSPKTGTEP